jgi:hypothetical protein
LRSTREVDVVSNEAIQSRHLGGNPLRSRMDKR